MGSDTTGCNPHDSTLHGVRIVGSTLLLASCIVAVVVGIHASFLGDDPAWLFDCNDTSCTDFWADARRHYRLTAIVCCGTALLAWAMIGAGIAPRHTARRVPDLHIPTAILIGAAPVVSALIAPVALMVSIPMLIGIVLSIHATAVVLAWGCLRRATCNDRAAWFVTGLAAITGELAAACGGALGVLIAMATTGVVLAFAAGIAFIGGLGAALLVVRSSQRWLTRNSEDETLDGTSDVPCSGALTRARGRWSPWWPFAVSFVIIMLSVWAARPVPAPDKDAWMWETAPWDPAPTSAPLLPAPQAAPPATAV